MKKPLVLAVAVCFGAMVLSSCYGPFQLTKKLYKWNGSVGEKWTNEAVFLIMSIIPVYGLAVLGDAVIFNSIEFWTGENPIASNTGKVKMITQGDEQAVLKISSADQLQIHLFKQYRPVGSFTLQRSPNGTVLTDADGKLLASAVTSSEGKVVLKDASGATIATR